MADGLSWDDLKKWNALLRTGHATAMLTHADPDTCSCPDLYKPAIPVPGKGVLAAWYGARDTCHVCLALNWQQSLHIKSGRAGLQNH